MKIIKFILYMLFGWLVEDYSDRTTDAPPPESKQYG